MYKKFVDDTIKEFRYDSEKEINTFIVSFFNYNRCKISNESINFYLCGYNLKLQKYIMRQIPCFLRKSIIDKMEPSYYYGTEIDIYYETYEELINKFSDLLKNQIRYEVDDVWEDGIIDEEYLIFDEKNPTGKELIYKNILKYCCNF